MKPPPGTAALRARAVLLACLLLLFNSYWLGYCEMIWHNAHLTTIAVPVNVLFLLLAVRGVNGLFQRVCPQAALRPADLIVIYAMLATGSAFVGHDFMPRLMGLLPHAVRYAAPENDWEGLFFRYLPEWLLVTDPRAVEGFYTGKRSFLGEGYWRFWLRPIGWWSTVVMLLMAAFLSLVVLFQRQWVRRERLAYPLVQTADAIARSGEALFRNRLFWWGFLLAAGLDLWNGLSYFYPVLPEIPVKRYDLIQYVHERPWNAIGSTPLRVHPLLTGLAYLAPLDISVSVVVFYLFRKLQQVFGAAVGVRQLPGYPFLGEQGAGALLALLAVTLWTGRGHLRWICRRLTAPAEPGSAALSHRAAALTLLLSLGGLTAILIRGGMSLTGAWLFLLVYLAIVLGLTRMRAELGPPIHAIGQATPQYLLITAWGTRWLGPGNLTMLSLLNWLSGASYASFRTHPMPHQMEAFKLAERVRLGERSMLIALAIAGATGVVGSLILYPTLIYKEGVPAVAEQIHAGGNDTYRFLASWLTAPRPPNVLALLALGGAFVLNLCFFFLRSRLLWMPIHPAGYVIGVAPGTTDILWFPLLQAVVLKWLLLRLGGFRVYRRGVPFFMGLVAGQASVGAFWPLLSLFTRTTVYSWI